MNNNTTFEDYSSALDKTSNLFKKWKNSSNTALISEDSLQRTLNVVKNSSFAIITAYRGNFSKNENILRNRKLRTILNQNKIGVHQLVGHFIEVQNNGTKKDVVERSYLIEKPDSLTDKEFCELIHSCLTIDGETQDSALLSLKSKDNNFYLMDNDMNFLKIGNKLSLNKIGDFYSQHVKKMNVPFVFEGEEIPGNNLGKVIYKKLGYCWSGKNGFGY